MMGWFAPTYDVDGAYEMYRRALSLGYGHQAAMGFTRSEHPENRPFASSSLGIAQEEMKVEQKLAA